MERVGVSESGASGAIFFFSKDNQFIAKSCTQEEMEHLKAVAPKLRDYFQQNPHTLITQVAFLSSHPHPHPFPPQIFGAYRLQMYAAQIFFFVSRNVLWSPPRDLPSPLRVDIFDLKGSTYGRQFKPPPTGTRVRCRHCNKSYQIGYPPPSLSFPHFSPSRPSPAWRRSREMEECTSYRRIHEPTGVRKDNDFFSRLPLLEEDYDRLILQVTRDLDFLSERLQVMDYSWLGWFPLSLHLSLGLHCRQWESQKLSARLFSTRVSNSFSWMR
jgi:hypothetical protein